MGLVKLRFGVDGWTDGIGYYIYKEVKSVLSALCVHWGDLSLSPSIFYQCSPGDDEQFPILESSHGRVNHC